MDKINAALKKIYALPETDCDERFDMAKIVGELSKECVLKIVEKSFHEKWSDSLLPFNFKVEEFKRYVKYQTLGDDCWIHCYECDKPHFGTDSEHKKESRSMMIYNYEIAVKNFKNNCENWFKEMSKDNGVENDAYRGDLFASMIFRMYTGTIEVL
jgi:hypothetical protein